MENNKTPKIRFKGFTDPWEQRKLGQLADIVGGGTPSTNVSNYWDGDIDWYAPAEISNQIYLTSSQRKITEEGYSNSSAKMLPIGTVLFTSRAGIGKTAILSRKGCTNQGFQSIVPHEDKLDSYFIFSRTEELKRYGETVGAGSTFVEVSGKQMANMDLMMPKTLREQKVIGQYFQNLDNLITLHQRKLELRFFPGCRFFIQGHTLTWCPATKEQGIAGSEAPRPTRRTPIWSQRRGARRRRTRFCRQHYPDIKGGNYDF